MKAKELSIKILKATASILGVIVVTCIATYIVASLIKYLNPYSVDYAARYQLKYYEYKSALVDEVESYIQNKAPSSNLTAYHLVTECEDYDIDLTFIIAQAQKESVFGTKGLAARTNSVWNLGAYDQTPYDRIAGIHKYDHPDESLTPYLKLLTERYLTDKSLEDLLENFVDESGHRYASDRRYEKDLKFIMDTIKNSTKIDSLESNMRYWKLKSQH